MKYVGQLLVNFLDHTNMPHFHLSSLGSDSTPKKNPKICNSVLKIKEEEQIKKNDSWFVLNSLILKKIRIFLQKTFFIWGSKISTK